MNPLLCLFQYLKDFNLQLYSETMINDREVSLGWTCYCLIQLRNKMFSRKTVCQGLYIDKTCFPDVFFDSPLNTDTRIIRTLWHVPLVSVLTGFHCTVTSLRSLLTNKNFQHSQKARKMIFMGLLGRCSLSPRVSLSHALFFLAPVTSKHLLCRLRC